jgi:hypothetical protein
VTVQSVLSDAAIWATILFLVIGVVAVVSIAIVWLRGRPGGRSPQTAAGPTIRRIVTVALVVYVAAFFAGLIVGAFQ